MDNSDNSNIENIADVLKMYFVSCEYVKVNYDLIETAAKKLRKRRASILRNIVAMHGINKLLVNAFNNGSTRVPKLSTKIFVGNLPHGTKPEKLRHLFEQYGVVVECDVMTHCGFIHMQTPAMADAAVAALNGIHFRGQSITVERGRPKERRGGETSSRSAGTSRSGEASTSRFSSHSHSNGGGASRSDSYRPQRSTPYSRGGRGGGGSSNGYHGRSNGSMNGGGDKYQNGGRFNDRQGGSNNRRDRSYSASSASNRNRDAGAYGGRSRHDGGGGFRSNMSNGNSSYSRNGHGGGQDRRGFALSGVGSRDGFRTPYNDNFQRRNSMTDMDSNGRPRRGGFGSSGGRDSSFRRSSHFNGGRDFSSMRSEGGGGRGRGSSNMRRNGPSRQNMSSRR